MSNLLSETIQRVLKKGFISNRWQRHSPPQPELSSRRQRECEKEGHIWPLAHLILSLKTEWMILWRWTTRWHFFACGCPPSGQTTARGGGAGTLTLSLFSCWSFFALGWFFHTFPFLIEEHISPLLPMQTLSRCQTLAIAIFQVLENWI